MLAFRECAVTWRLSALTLLAVCLGVLPGSQSAGTERRLGDSYSVSQAYKLLVHDSGNVDVVMQIDFHLDPGAQLSGSYKSILSDTSIQSIESDPEHPGGRVIATDSAGRSLAVTIAHQDGWSRVDFTFPEVVYGTTTPTYTIKLAYTVVNGICMRSLRFRHIGLPWAHAWAVTVLESKYDIGFANPNMELIMDTVCFGALGFSLKCGHEPLSITGRQASYQATGLPFDVFFEWSGTSSDSSDRLCTGQEASGSDLVLVKSADAGGISGKAEQKNAGAPLIVGMVAIGLSCLFAVFVCTIALKKLPPRRRKSSRGSSSTDLGSMMTIDEAMSDSSGGGSASGEKADRRPKPLSKDIIDDSFQLQPYRSGAVDLKEHAGIHDNGGGAWSLGGDAIVGGLMDWDVENEFPQDDKFAMPIDSGQQTALGIRQLCNAPASMPPPVPESRLRAESRLRSRGTVGQFLDDPGVDASPAHQRERISGNDWQAMSEFDDEDDIERGTMMQTSGHVITLNGATVADSASDPEIPEMQKSSVIPMRELTGMSSQSTSDARRTGSVGYGSGGSDMWDTMDEFSDTGSRCNASLKFSL